MAPRDGISAVAHSPTGLLINYHSTGCPDVCNS